MKFQKCKAIGCYNFFYRNSSHQQYCDKECRSIVIYERNKNRESRKMPPEYHAAYFQKHKHTKFSEYRRRRRERNPDRTEEHRKARLSKYKLSLEQYNKLLESQDGVCKVCKRTNGKMSLAIDHDHSCCKGLKTCGKCIRGLLCNRCNSVLGLLRDNQELLDKLKLYLQETTACFTTSSQPESVSSQELFALAF